MYKEMLQQWFQINKVILDPVFRVHQIATGAALRLAFNQLDIVAEYLTGSTRHVQLVSQAKGLKEVIDGEVQLASELGEKMVGHGRESLMAWTQARDELSALVKDGLVTVLSPVPPSAKQAS